MTEKEKIQKILGLAIGINNKYEDAFPILFELCNDQDFMERGAIDSNKTVEVVKKILQFIASAQAQICKIEKWKIKEVRPSKVNAYFLKEYHMYHINITFSTMIFIAIVFPGVKRGLVQGYHLVTKRTSYSKIILNHERGTVN